MVPKKLLRQIYTPLAWTILIQVLFLLPGNSLPAASLLKIPHFDKMVHIIFMAGFVGLWSFYFYLQNRPFRQLKLIFFFLFMIAMTNGILVEFIQFYYIPFRSFDEGDIVADIMGASFAYGFANIFLLKQDR